MFSLYCMLRNAYVRSICNLPVITKCSCSCNFKRMFSVSLCNLQVVCVQIQNAAVVKVLLVHDAGVVCADDGCAWGESGLQRQLHNNCTTENGQQLHWLVLWGQNPELRAAGTSVWRRAYSPRPWLHGLPGMSQLCEPVQLVRMFNCINKTYLIALIVFIHSLMWNTASQGFLLIRQFSLTIPTYLFWDT